MGPGVLPRLLGQKQDACSHAVIAGLSADGIDHTPVQNGAVGSDSQWMASKALPCGETA